MSAGTFVMPAPHPKERRIIFENISKEGYDASLETYLKHGGYESLKKALGMKPGEIVDLVKAANLIQVHRAAPDATSILTWNAEENRYMLDVNEALGFRQVLVEAAFQRRL